MVIDETSWRRPVEVQKHQLPSRWRARPCSGLPGHDSPRRYIHDLTEFGQCEMNCLPQRAYLFWQWAADTSCHGTLSHAEGHGRLIPEGQMLRADIEACSIEQFSRTKCASSRHLVTLRAQVGAMSCESSTLKVNFD